MGRRRPNKPEDFPEWRPSDRGAGIEARIPITLYRKSGRRNRKLGTIMVPAAEIAAAAEDQDEILAKAIHAYHVLRGARKSLDRERLKEYSLPDEAKKALADIIGWEIYKYALEVYEYQLKRALESGNELPERPWLEVSRQGEEIKVKIDLGAPEGLDGEKLDEWFGVKGALCRELAQKTIELAEGSLVEFIWQHLTAWTLFDMEDDLGHEAVMAMPQEEFDRKFEEYFPRGKRFAREVIRLIGYFTDDLTRWVIEAINFPKLTLEQLERLLGLLKDGEPLPPPRPPLPFSLSPFGKNGLAPFASASPAYGAAKAIFAARRGWATDEEGRPRYVHDIDGDKLKGRIIYHIILPWDATEEEITIAHKELAWEILKTMGPDTAWLHMLLLAYAVDPTRRDDRTKKFVIPREEIYRCLGLDKRSDLSRREKDRRALEEIKKLRHLGLQIAHLQWAGKKTVRRKGENREVDLYNWDRTVGPLWEISLHEFGQSYIDWDESGNTVTRWSDWQLIGSEGPWGDIFLHGDKSLRQFGYVAREMLEKVDRYHCPWGAALAVMLTFQARFNPFRPVEVTNREIIDFAGGEEYPTDFRRRYDIKQQVLNAIEEQRKWGLEPDYSLWPEYLRPGGDADRADNLEEAPWDACPEQRLPAGYWDDFLRCKTIFRPVKGSQAEAMVQANRQVKYLPEPAAVPALPEPKKPKKKAWVGSDIKELREKLGMTQKQLAAYLEVDPTLVSHLERGKRHPSSELKKKLAELERRLQT